MRQFDTLHPQLTSLHITLHRSCRARFENVSLANRRKQVELFDCSLAIVLIVLSFYAITFVANQMNGR